jgi:hypothetical protein
MTAFKPYYVHFCGYMLYVEPNYDSSDVKNQFKLRTQCPKCGGPTPCWSYNFHTYRMNGWALHYKRWISTNVWWQPWTWCSGWWEDKFDAEILG